jgi:hypothetical protein
MVVHYWLGGSENNNPVYSGNWSYSVGGDPVETTPQFYDVAVFPGSASNGCNFHQVLRVKHFVVEDGYAETINPANNTLQINGDVRLPPDADFVGESGTWSFSNVEHHIDCSGVFIGDAEFFAGSPGDTRHAVRGRILNGTNLVFDEDRYNGNNSSAESGVLMGLWFKLNDFSPGQDNVVWHREDAIAPSKMDKLYFSGADDDNVTLTWEFRDGFRTLDISTDAKPIEFWKMWRPIFAYYLGSAGYLYYGADIPKTDLASGPGDYSSFGNLYLGSDVDGNNHCNCCVAEFSSTDTGTQSYTYQNLTETAYTFVGPVDDTSYMCPEDILTDRYTDKNWYFPLESIDPVESRWGHINDNHWGSGISDGGSLVYPSGFRRITFESDCAFGNFEVRRGYIDFNGKEVTCTGVFKLHQTAHSNPRVRDTDDAYYMIPQVQGSGLPGTSIIVNDNCYMSGNSTIDLDLQGEATWRIAVDVSTNVNYLTVKNSNAASGSAFYPPGDTTTNLGTNVNWFFTFLLGSGTITSNSLLTATTLYDYYTFLDGVVAGGSEIGSLSPSVTYSLAGTTAGDSSVLGVLVRPYSHDAILDYVFGGVSYYAPTGIQFALSSDEVLTEPGAAEYNRVAMDNDKNNWSVATGGSLYLQKQIDYPTTASAWGSISGVMMLDEYGSQILFSPLLSPTTLNNAGQTIAIPSGYLTISLQ